MWMYVLILLCLSLAGVAGLQFFYMIYLERMEKERQKHIQELEHHCRYLTQRLQDAEKEKAKFESAEENADKDAENENEEVWADVLDDR